MIQYDSEMQLPGQAISVAPPSEWSLEQVPVLYKNQYNTSPKELAREERAIRQRFMESTFKDDAASGAGAVGAYQIMPGVHGDYVSRTGEKGDLRNYEYNKAVRDWYIDWLSQRGAISKGNPSENVRLARIYAAYNWGLGNLGKFLNAKREAGIDVDNSLDWIDMLPKETKNYVKFIVLGEDIGGTDRNSATMNRLLGRDSSPVIPMAEKIPEGPLFYDNGGKLTKLVERINKTSNADFVKRLLDEKRRVLNNQDGTVSTHELGYVDDGNGNAIVFPSVQSSNGTLLRYPYPESLDKAIENGDTVHMSVPEAEMFTRKYKEYYPGFNEYGDGTGGKIGKFLRRMANAAVMNDPNSGAVAQASGYLLDPSGELTQNPEDEGAKQLSKNIAVLSAVPNAIVAEQTLPTALGVLADPVKASTEAGAASATALDAAGLVDAAQGLGLDVNRVINGQYGFSDIPGTLLRVPIMLPGGNLLASPSNLNIASSQLKLLKEYPSGVLDRAAESVVRMGDYAEYLGTVIKHLKDARTRKYIFDPLADKNLAYRLGYTYSGESSSIMNAHPGDVVDQWIGKSSVPDASYDTGTLPKFLRDYIKKNYPGKKIPIRTLRDVHYNGTITRPSTADYAKLNAGESVVVDNDFGMILDDNTLYPVLDPGGHNSIITKDGDILRYDNWDIWKFNADDYAERYLTAPSWKRPILKAGLRFIDSRGTPIVHHWATNELGIPAHFK